MLRQQVLPVVVVVTVVLCAIVSSQTLLSKRRFVSRQGTNQFRLTGKPSGNRALNFRGVFGNIGNTQTSRVRHGSKGRRGNKDRPTPQTSALRAGEEGSFDFGDQINAILPNKAIPKPTKQPITTANPNKINIETPIGNRTEPAIRVEKATLGGTAILHCYFDHQAQIGDFRHSEIWWTKQPERKGDRPIILGAGAQIRIPDDRLRIVRFDDDTFSILIIKYVLATDAGEYKCSLPTVSGTQTDFMSLIVYDPANEQVVFSEKENVVEVGGDLTLFCNPEDTSLPVWWSAETHEGARREVEKGSMNYRGAELDLKRVSRNKAGVYTCHVDVRVGSPITEEFNVYVKEKPWQIVGYKSGFNMDTFLSKFARDPEYGDEVNLRCDSGGIPVPAITWFKDRERIEASDDKFQIKETKPSFKENAVTSSLTILDFQPEDEGRYYCNAMNQQGQRQREFTMKGFYDMALPVQLASSNRRTPRPIFDDSYDYEDGSGDE